MIYDLYKENKNFLPISSRPKYQRRYSIRGIYGDNGNHLNLNLTRICFTITIFLLYFYEFPKNKKQSTIRY